MILGAGFSSALDIPGTTELTTMTRAFGLVHSRIGAGAKMIYQAMKREFPKANFELALHAIETLMSYCAPDHFDDEDADSARQILRCFTEPREDRTELFDFDALTALRARFIKAIVTAISDATPDSGSPRYVLDNIEKSRQLLTKLDTHFKIRCFTLNYDTLIDDHLNWSDGFNSVGRFSRAGFKRELRLPRAMLCHLHGSVNFGFDENGLLAKFSNPSEALETYDSERLPKINQAYEYNLGGPVVSGLRKLDKLTSTPYAYYYNALVNALVESPRLLIVGYGFGDDHLNYWLGQHKAIHGDGRRVVVVTKDADEADPARTPTLQRLSRLVPKSIRAIPADLEISTGRDRSTRYAHSREFVGIMSGYPLTAFGRNLVVDHFTSKPSFEAR